MSKPGFVLIMTVGLLTAVSCGGGPPPEPRGATVTLDGLMWTVEDNGRDIDWNAALAYCEDLALDGFTDWGLPTVPQLEALYDPAESYIPPGGTAPVHVKDPIELTSDSVWSSERSGTGSAWYFFFARGYRNSHQLVNPSNRRALCVRVP